MQQDQKQRNEWWKARSSFYKCFAIIFTFGLFILIFPRCPFYRFARDKILDSRNMQFMALFATLLGFSYLDKISHRQKERMKEETERRNQKGKLIKKKERLKEELIKKEYERSEKFQKGDDVSRIDEEISGIKEEIILVQDEMYSF